MANTVNLFAEIGANMIGDDAQPTLELTNSSTGPGLKVDRLVATSSATINAGNLLGATAFSGETTTVVPVTISRTVIGSPTYALMHLNASTASAPMFSLGGGAFVSAVSIVFAASTNWAGLGAIRVMRPDLSLGWIPVLPDGVITGAVVA